MSKLEAVRIEDTAGNMTYVWSFPGSKTMWFARVAPSGEILQAPVECELIMGADVASLPPR